MRAKARTYFLVGADRDDIIQEGMIGLYKATRDFRHDKLASFRAFCRTMYYTANYYGHKICDASKARTTQFLYFFK